MQKKEYFCLNWSLTTDYTMKKLLALAGTLFAICNLSAQTYKVGDLYDVDGKRGVVFEISADGQHGKIVADTQSSEKMTWHEAMAWGKQLKGGWYIPSYEELKQLLDVRSVVGERLKGEDGKLPNFSWTTTEFDPNSAWAVSLRTESQGGFYKRNKFGVCIVSKF